MKKLIKRLKTFWVLSRRLARADYYIINSWKAEPGWKVSHYLLPEGRPEEAMRLAKEGYECILIFLSKLVINKRLKEDRN